MGYEDPPRSGEKFVEQVEHLLGVPCSITQGSDVAGEEIDSERVGIANSFLDALPMLLEGRGVGLRRHKKTDNLPQARIRDGCASPPAANTEG